MNMERRQRFFQCPAEFDVMPTVHAGRQAGLNANFGGAEVISFLGAPNDFLERQEIAFLGQMTAAEGAEAAGLDANVGKIDVAVNDVGDHVARGARAKMIGGGDQSEKVRSI